MGGAIVVGQYDAEMSQKDNLNDISMRLVCHVESLGEKNRSRLMAPG